MLGPKSYNEGLRASTRFLFPIKECMLEGSWQWTRLLVSGRTVLMCFLDGKLKQKGDVLAVLWSLSTTK
jgi:hypothetical protein